ELMAIFSTVVVWAGRTPAARAAGIRYAIMHLLGGVILKVGIEGIVVHTGSVDIQPMLATNFDTWMVLTGILINVAAPPVSAWLADAYPESSPTGSVFLSAFTTKSAVLALILLFPGESVLIWVGLYMVFYGIIYALLENDARRILAYSVVNQVGFMVCAVGIGTEMALIRAHYLQGVAVHVGGGGAVPHRIVPLHRSRWPVPYHAVYHRVRHYRRVGHFEFPADLRVYDQNPDFRGSGAAGSGACLLPACCRLGRGVPARGYQVSLVCVLPEGFRPAPERRALEHGAGDGHIRVPVYFPRRVSRAAVGAAALSG
ncbi:MAG: hypothetical protein KDI09_17275, partial [Halioglobus sp.]|nr:hypothetical protein [Halioglobus sp.]